MSELREVMEAEMRTQLRRQAAAHTDHVRDVLKVQEQELTAEAEQVIKRIPERLTCSQLFFNDWLLWQFRKILEMNTKWRDFFFFITNLVISCVTCLGLEQ